MTPNEIAEKARQMIADKPELEAPMRVEWGTVCDMIDERAKNSLSTYPLHELKTNLVRARLAMLTAFVEGKSMDEARTAALVAAGFEVSAP